MLALHTSYKYIEGKTGQNMFVWEKPLFYFRNMVRDVSEGEEPLWKVLLEEGKVDSIVNWRDNVRQCSSKSLRT